MLLHLTSKKYIETVNNEIASKEILSSFDNTKPHLFSIDIENPLHNLALMGNTGSRAYVNLQL